MATEGVLGWSNDNGRYFEMDQWQWKIFWNGAVAAEGILGRTNEENHLTPDSKKFLKLQ